jgi:hypothetical protein
VMTSAAVVPTKAAVLGGHAPAAAPQHMVALRQVASKVAPPPRPVSFEQQRPLLEQSNGVPLSAATRSDLRKANPAPAPKVGQPTNPSAANKPGGRGIMQPGGNSSGRPPATPQPGGTPAIIHAPTANAPATGRAGDNMQRNPQSTPAATQGNTGKPAATEAPRTNQSGQNAGTGGAVAPAHPATPTAVAPAHPATPATPVAPAHAVTPPAPIQNTPPAKEGKDKSKEKDKEKDPRGR